MIQVAVNNYERLAETLPVGISRADLKITSSNLALLFIRHLPHDAKQYCVLHSESETWEALQAARLKYERQQRQNVELVMVAVVMGRGHTRLRNVPQT